MHLLSRSGAEPTDPRNLPFLGRRPGDSGAPTLKASSHVVHAIAILRGVGATRTRALDAGEAQALAVIYRAYGGMLLAALRQLLGGQGDAEDALHDVFARLPWAIAKYRDDSFGGWLRQMAVRVALTRMRTARRRRECVLSDVAYARAAEVDPVDFEALERRDTLERAIGQLSEPLRHVVVLRVYLDFSHQQVAESLGITPTASEVRMCRALKQLRAMLRQPPLSRAAGT